MEPTINVSEIWTAQQAAEYRKISDSTVRNLAKKKEIPGRHIGSSGRFYRDEFENLSVE